MIFKKSITKHYQNYKIDSFKKKIDFFLKKTNKRTQRRSKSVCCHKKRGSALEMGKEKREERKKI
jgi:hypothetical protein